MPRGLLERLDAALGQAGSRLVVEDRRPLPEPLPLEFHGKLTAQQQSAVAALLAHDRGVLGAPPGTGKTVIACALTQSGSCPR